MIGYMLLGAWVLTLIILGFVVISTGLPQTSEIDDNSDFVAWVGKIIYLFVLAWTFYEMGAHFSDL